MRKRDYSGRDYIEMDATNMTRRQGRRLVEQAVETSLRTCKKSLSNTFLIKFDVLPNPVLFSLRAHKVHTRKRGAQRNNLSHFTPAEGESHRTLTFSDDPS